MTKETRTIVFIAVGIALVILLAVLIWAWPSLRFKYDRGVVEDALHQIGDDHKVLGKASFVPKRLTSPSTTGPFIAHTFYDHRVRFPKGDFMVRTADQNVLKCDDLRVSVSMIVAGDVNAALSLSSSEVAEIRKRPGGDAIISYLQSKEPFDILRAIYKSAPTDMDSATDYNSKYKALYLNSLRGVLLPDVTIHGLEEYETDTAKGFISGDAAKDRHVVVDVYCKMSKTFFAVEFTNNGSGTAEDVLQFLAGLEVAPDKSP